MALTQESAARKDETTGADVRMEHRHFAFIAATLANLKPLDRHALGETVSDYAETERKWRKTVDRFADACERTNPKFDRARFLRACGVAS